MVPTLPIHRTGGPGLMASSHPELFFDKAFMNKQSVNPLKRMFVMVGLVALVLLIVGIVQYELLQQYIVDLIHQLKKGR